MSAAKNLPFTINTSDGYTTIRIGGRFDVDQAKALESVIPSITKDPSNVIVNCEGLLEFMPAGIRALMQLQQKLKTGSKQMRLIGVSDRVAAFLKQEGVDTSLKAAPSLRSALTEFGLVTQKSVDVNFVNPFLEATLKVLQTQCSTTAKAGQVYKKSSSEKFMGDISGVIGLVSDAFTGTVVISFPAQTFLRILSRMIGEEVKEITKDSQDGAGELTNIIFGQAKITLNQKGYGIKTALPSVIAGQDHSILSMSNGPRVVIPFETDVGPFFVEICVSN